MDSNKDISLGEGTTTQEEFLNELRIFSKSMLEQSHSKKVNLRSGRKTKILDSDFEEIFEQLKGDNHISSTANPADFVYGNTIIVYLFKHYK